MGSRRRSKERVKTAIGTLDSLLKNESLTNRKDIFQTLQMMETLVSKIQAVSPSVKEEPMQRTPSVAVDVSNYFKED